MPSLEQKLMQLLLGKRGGSTRTSIIQLLMEKPYNTNQLAQMLGLNYRTVKYHIIKLLKNGIIEGSGIEGYGQTYHLTSEMKVRYDRIDATMKKLNEIKTSPLLFEKTFKQTRDAVFLLNTDGKVLFMNESAEALYGYSEDDVLGRALMIFDTPDLLKDAVENIGEVKEIGPLDTKGRTKAGEVIDINAHIEAIQDNEGNIMGVHVLSRDIRERKRAENQLMDVQDYLEDVLETIPIPLVLLDEDSDIIYANPSFCELFDIELKDSLRKNLHEVGNKHLDIPELKEIVRDIVSDGVPISNYRIEMAAGKNGKKGGRWKMLLNARPLQRALDKSRQILLTLEELPR